MSVIFSDLFIPVFFIFIFYFFYFYNGEGGY